MLHKTLVVVLIAMLLTAVPVESLSAQDSSTGGIDQPVTLDSVQVVPVTVDVSVPVDGETITTTLPLSAEVSVRVQLVDNPTVADEPFPLVFLEDALLLLPVLGEMPVGFIQPNEPAAASSNETIAEQYADSAAFLKYLNEEARRLGGAYVEFTNSQNSPFSGGNGYIGVSALIMADAAGADEYLEGAMERELERSDTVEAVYRVSAPRLGDNSVLYKADVTENNAQYSDYTLWVRINNALLSFDSRAMRDKGNVDQLLTLARTILARGLNQPQQEGATALMREGQPQADTPAQKSAAEQPNPTPKATEAEAKSTIWDLPHYVGRSSDVMDISGFQVQVNGVGLFDFAQVKAFDPENERYFDNSAFESATVFGVLDMTLTNGADRDLSLPSTDAVLVVGSEQVQLSDFRYLGDDPFGEALLPGVKRQATMIFTLTETAYDELGASVDVRLQMRGPIDEDYDAVVKDAKYQTSLTLTSAP